MTTPPAKYSFLPWVRQGVVSGLATTTNDAAALPGRVQVAVTLRVQANAMEQVQVPVRLLGPGDVTGIDPRQVIRMDPRPGTSDHEPNYFPAIEFDRPDFPWMFTPAARGVNDRLRPWLVLVVVREQPGVKLTTPRDRPAAVLRFDTPADAAKELPDLAESHAWAHAQVSRTDDATVDALLASRPERVISRLVCPRRLDPQTTYFACVVPAFDAGRKAGLGLDVDANADLAPAWSLQAGIPDGFELPVYHSWKFSTGASGDFESLVRALKARILPDGIGRRDMDVGAADPALPLLAPDAEGAVLGLEGALRAPPTRPTPWPPASRAAYQAQLRAILDAPEDAATAGATDPIVAPPLYGRWLAARRRTPGDAERPHWLRELNLDPRTRAAAGFGTRVVQENQEPLMASAWQQVGDVLRANALLRQAQLARAAAQRIHERHLARLRPGALLSATRATHARFRMSPVTLHALTKERPALHAALSPAMRRVSRPRGPLGRRVRAPDKRVQGDLVERINAGEISPTLPAQRPVRVATAPPRAPAWAIPLAILLLILGLVLIAVGAVMLALVAFLAAAVAGYVAWRAASTAPPAGSPAPGDSTGPAASGVPTPETVQAAPPQPGFVVDPGAWRPPGAPPPSASAPGAAASAGVDSPEAARFRAAAAAQQARIAAVLARAAPKPAPAPLDLDATRVSVLERLDPEVTVVAHVRSRILVPAAVWDPDDPIEPILAAPEFPQPMYEPLRDLSQDLLLPGIEKIQPNTITIVETNPPFIESYMVGLNHEMARELLWREYPTDQRGTCFRQFWDVRGRVPAPTTDAEREALKDIPPIHAWQGRTHLGEHLGGGTAPKLVLLIRGELLRRYPSAVIYAVRARWNAGKRDLGTEEKHPLFRGTLPPDITFLGFDLTVDEAVGSTQPDQDPGWFFVLQQMPSEPRFGLDVASTYGGTPTSWDDLSWGDLAANAAGLEALVHVPVPAQPGTYPRVSGIHSPTNVAWGKNAASMAYITLQRPFRAAIHADDMVRRGASP